MTQSASKSEHQSDPYGEKEKGLELEDTLVARVVFVCYSQRTGL